MSNPTNDDRAYDGDSMTLTVLLTGWTFHNWTQFYLPAPHFDRPSSGQQMGLEAAVVEGMVAVVDAVTARAEENKREKRVGETSNSSSVAPSLASATPLSHSPVNACRSV